MAVYMCRFFEVLFPQMIQHVMYIFLGKQKMGDTVWPTQPLSHQHTHTHGFYEKWYICVLRWPLNYDRSDGSNNFGQNVFLFLVFSVRPSYALHFWCFCQSNCCQLCHVKIMIFHMIINTHTHIYILSVYQGHKPLVLDRNQRPVMCYFKLYSIFSK